MRIIRGLVWITFKTYFKLFNKIEKIGMENLPKTGAYVLASNHIHWLDSLLYVSLTRRMIFAVGKEELFSNPIKNFIMRRLGVYPIKRDAVGSNAASISSSIKRLKQGYLFLIFPEGTRMGFYKGVRPHKGVAMFALEAKVPIIPMAMVGSFKKHSTVKLIIDKPMDVSEFYPKDGEKVDPRNIVKVSNKVIDRIIELRDSIQTEEIEKEMLEEEKKREQKRMLKGG